MLNACSSRHRTSRSTPPPWWSSAAAFATPSVSMPPAAPPSVRRRSLCSRNRPTNSGLSRHTICTNNGSCHRPGKEPSRSPRSSFHRRAAAARWRVVSGASRPSHPAPARSGPLGCLHQESRRESCPQQESLPATPASDFSPIWGIEVYCPAQDARDRLRRRA